MTLILLLMPFLAPITASWPDLFNPGFEVEFDALEMVYVRNEGTEWWVIGVATGDLEVIIYRAATKEEAIRFMCNMQEKE